MRVLLRARWLLALLLLALSGWLLVVSQSTSANATVAKQHLPQATLIGSGSFRWLGLKLYDASLWAERANFNADQWQSAPLALELNYARTLEGRRIAEASVDEMKKLGIGSATQHKSWGEAMKQVFPDVDKTTQLTGVYLPGKGCQFYVDGKLQHEVDDPAFARAFFSIWLDPQTRSPKLRAALLGLNP